jgi:ADP-ribosylglycohydrolase
VVLSNTDQFCRATHADPRCVAACVVVAKCVAQLLQGADEDIDVETHITRAVSAGSRCNIHVRLEPDRYFFASETTEAT